MDGDTAITAIASDVPTIDVPYHEMNHADASLYDVAAPGMYTGGDVRHMPAYLDLDKDGFISKKELDWNADGRIEDIDLDLNGDGEVNGDDGWLPNFERQATGQGIDPDNDPDTPRRPCVDGGRPARGGHRPRPPKRDGTTADVTPNCGGGAAW